MPSPLLLRMATGSLLHQGRARPGAVLSPSHLFPIDVARCYGDHGGFSHKPREEGAHAQGGSVYPGTRTQRASVLRAPRRHREPKPSQNPEKVLATDGVGRLPSRSACECGAPNKYSTWVGEGPATPTPAPGLSSAPAAGGAGLPARPRVPAAFRPSIDGVPGEWGPLRTRATPSLAPLPFHLAPARHTTVDAQC